MLRRKNNKTAQHEQPATNIISAFKFAQAQEGKGNGFTIPLPRHQEQPPAHETSKEARKEVTQFASPRSVAFWQNVFTAYEACRVAIEADGSFRETRVGKAWLGIVERRLQLLKEDEAKLSKVISLNTQYGNPVDDVQMKQKCRKQEDRMRRLRSAVIDWVVERPSRANKWDEDGVTYEDKVQSILRDAYERCAKARRVFADDVAQAVKKEDDRRRDGRR